MSSLISLTLWQRASGLFTMLQLEHYRTLLLALLAGKITRMVDPDGKPYGPGLWTYAWQGDDLTVDEQDLSALLQEINMTIGHLAVVEHVGSAYVFVDGVRTPVGEVHKRLSQATRDSLMPILVEWLWQAKERGTFDPD